MNKWLLVFYFTFSGGISAQEVYNSEDIKVTNRELAATTYDMDTKANALYIYEKGFSRFQEFGQFNLISDYSAKIKLLNPDGYKNANIEIRLRKSKNGKEKIHKLEATTFYLENGIKKGVKLDPAQVYIEENETYDLVKFTFPNISPGAVLVYSYQKESPFIFNFETWWFQSDIPKIYSGFDTKIFGNYNYNIKKVGELKLDVNTSEIERRCFIVDQSSTPADCVVASYAMKNIPAFVEEPYLTSRYNFISRIEYELIEIHKFDGSINKYTKTWKDVDKELKFEKSIGGQLKRNSVVKDILPESLQQKTNNLSKAKEIFEFVKQNYKWNRDYNIFKDVDIKDLLKDKTGNISSINILLHNLLEDQGFEVLPVLSSTRGNGLPTKLYPVLSEFNILMVQLEINGIKYILDATEKNVAFGDIPFRNLNQYGRLLDFENGSSWIDFENTSFSSIVIRDSLTLNPDGTAAGRSEHIFIGYHATNTRNSLENKADSEIANTASNFQKHTRVATSVIRNKELVSEPIHIDHILFNESQKINDAIYFNPFSFKFFNKNPFQRETRHYPIDFGYKDSYSYIINVIIPENHQVVELPQSKLLRLPENGGSLIFSVQKTDERNLLINYRITFPQAIYSSEFYPYLQQFFDAILEVENQSLIVIKANT